MKTEVFRTTETLIGLSSKLLELQGGTAVETPAWRSCRPMDYNSWYCRTHVKGCEAGQEAAVARELADGIRSGALPWLMDVSEEAVSAQLLEELDKVGFVLRKAQAGMVLETAAYIPAAPNPNVVRIDKSRVEEWSRVCMEAFGKGDETPAMALLIGRDDCRFYAYLEEGKIVATLMMSLQDDNAGIHEVGTLADYRGRGYCTALLHRAFTEAKEEGYPILSLQASVYGEPVYRAMGMRRVCTIRNCELK